MRGLDFIELALAVPDVGFEVLPSERDIDCEGASRERDGSGILDGIATCFEAMGSGFAGLLFFFGFFMRVPCSSSEGACVRFPVTRNS